MIIDSHTHVDEAPAYGWFDPPEAIVGLMDEAESAANVPIGEKHEVLDEAISSWPDLQSDLENLMRERATELEEAHARLRQVVGGGTVRVEPQMPPDLLGVLVLLPLPQGVR